MLPGILIVHEGIEGCLILPDHFQGGFSTEPLRVRVVLGMTYSGGVPVMNLFMTVGTELYRLGL